MFYNGRLSFELAGFYTNCTFSHKRLLKGLSFLFHSFRSLSFTKSSLLLFAAPLCTPHESSRARAWALALTSDIACNQSYHRALPSSQATDGSLTVSPPLPPPPTPSPPVPLFVPFPHSWIHNGHAVFLKGSCSETMASKHALGDGTTGPRPRCQTNWPYASIRETTLN